MAFVSENSFPRIGYIFVAFDPGFSLNSTTTITPTISITDEHNRSLLPTSNSHDPLNFQLQSNQNEDQPTGFQRPATVIGFSPSSSASSSPDNPHPPTPNSIQAMDTSSAPPAKPNGVKFVFIPVSIPIALERLKRFINGRNIAYEVSENNEAGM